MSDSQIAVEIPSPEQFPSEPFAVDRIRLRWRTAHPCLLDVLDQEVRVIEGLPLDHAGTVKESREGLTPTRSRRYMLGGVRGTPGRVFMEGYQRGCTLFSQSPHHLHDVIAEWNPQAAPDAWPLIRDLVEGLGCEVGLAEVLRFDGCKDFYCSRDRLLLDDRLRKTRAFSGMNIESQYVGAPGSALETVAYDKALEAWEKRGVHLPEGVTRVEYRVRPEAKSDAVDGVGLRLRVPNDRRLFTLHGWEFPARRTRVRIAPPWGVIEDPEYRWAALLCVYGGMRDVMSKAKYVWGKRRREAFLRCLPVVDMAGAWQREWAGAVVRAFGQLSAPVVQPVGPIPV